MNPDELIQEVDIDQLYSHVLNLEGIRHPLANQRNLTNAGEYIMTQLENFGYIVQKQEFALEGFDEPFYNVEAFAENTPDQQIWVTAHFDTVYRTPGADDSASSVAIMLETARILSKTDQRKYFRFVCFTLEEGNPVYERAANQAAIAAGLFDEKLRATSHAFEQKIALVWKTVLLKREEGSKDILDDAIAALGDRLNEKEIQWVNIRFQGLEKSQESTINHIQGWGLMGSQYAALYVKENDIKITAIINLETIGYTSTKEGSQEMVPGLDPTQLPKNNTSDNLSVGDFAFIVSDSNSLKVGKSFFDNSANPLINLASTWMHVPFDYQTIVRQVPDILRSDHGPFWKDNVPGIMITDTANFRNPNYHRPGDTIDTLDFEFIVKVCQTTVLCSLDLIEG